MSKSNFNPCTNGLRTRWHAFGHLLLLAVGWALFVLCWWMVLRQTWETRLIEQLILGTVVIVPTLTVLWVLHNLRIYRRLGPRKAVPQAQLRYEVDFNGRRVEADWPLLQQANFVVIERGETSKRFVAVPPTVPPRLATTVEALPEAQQIDPAETPEVSSATAS